MRRITLLLPLLLLACSPPKDDPGKAPSAQAPVTSATSAAAKAPPSAPAEAPKPSAALPPPPTSASAAAKAPPGKVVFRGFSSDALGVPKSYFVYLPPDYDSTEKRYPVLTMLHGYGGDETNWIRAGKLPEAAAAAGLSAIVVMPDGDDSFYANWASPVAYSECVDHRPSAFGRTEQASTYCVQRPRYEDYIAKDLIKHVDATFRTVADRKARAILGVSMGGFGALMLAMRHKDVWSVAVSHSGVVAPLYDGPHPFREGAVSASPKPGLAGKFPDDLRDQASRVFGFDVSHWRAHDPSQLAAGLKDGELALYLDCGTEDGYQLADHARYVHEVLGKAGVQHTFELVPGGHSFLLWRERLPKSLAFVMAAFAKNGH